MIDTTIQEKKKMNCDQVSWVMSILGRLQSSSWNHPAVSRLPEALNLAALLEIMDVLGYEFEDNDAAGNALHKFEEFSRLRKVEPLPRDKFDE